MPRFGVNSARCCWEGSSRQPRPHGWNHFAGNSEGRYKQLSVGKRRSDSRSTA